MNAEFNEFGGSTGEAGGKLEAVNGEMQNNLIGHVMEAMMAEAKPNAIEKPVQPAAKADMDDAAADGIKVNSFELATGHKVVGAQGRYKISDSDGNFVKIFPNGLEAGGKVVSNVEDKTGNHTVKFQNGSTIIYSQSGRLNITGANGKSSVIILEKFHQPPLDPQFPRPIRRW